MSDWSKYFQTPEFLEATRSMVLDDDMLSVIIKWIGIKPRMKILDVGCGTGAFSYYLSRGIEDCQFVGVDLDSLFIQKAREKIAHNSINNNSFEFIEDNALKMPFENDSFDIVVSHTFLTNMQNPTKTLREMMRVGKTGGIVASITAQSIDNIPLHQGFYPISKNDYYSEWMQMLEKVWIMCDALYSMKDFLSDVSPQLVPRAFVDAGMWHICMHGIGKGVSLSNAAISDDVKRAYILEYRNAEQKKFDAFSKMDGFSKYFSQTEADRYRELVDIRHDRLLEDVGENTIWEWTGGSNILMTGVIPPTMRTLLKLKNLIKA